MIFKLLVIICLQLSLISANALDWPLGSAGEIDSAECLKSFPNSFFIERPKNNLSLDSEKFNFFYFLNQKFDRSKPTLLYVDGGPGQITGAYVNTLRFKNLTDYNVVYFHPRGSGCSVVPQDNLWDPDLRMSNSMSDLEALKIQLGIQKWDIIYAVSYGTVFTLKYLDQFKTASIQLILEGFFDPSFVKSDEDQIGLLINKGMPSSLLIMNTWNEFGGLDQKYKNHIELQFKNLLEDKSIYSWNGAEIDFSDFFQKSNALFYHGVAGQDDFNKTLALNAMLNILSLFIPESELQKLNIQLKFTVDNKFPISSQRLAVLTRIYEGLDYELIDLLSQTGFGKAVSAAYGQDVGQLVYPIKNYVTQVESLNVNLDPSVRVTIIQGEKDGITPVEAAERYFSTNTSVNTLIKMTDMGHARQFNEDCYPVLFKHILSSSLEDNLFSEPASKCYSPYGHKLFQKFEI